MHLNPDPDDVVRATRSWYDDMADRYAERTSDYRSFPGLQDEVARFTESLASVPGCILDLGCGAGRDADYFARHGRRVVAADLSIAMLRRTRTSLRGSGPSHCVQLDLRRLPFAADSFAGVWVCASLVHVPPSAIPGCLGEAHRTVKPGGRIAISMKTGTRTGWMASGYLPGERWFTLLNPERLFAMMGDQGFVELSGTSKGRDGWFIAYGTKR